MTQATTDTEADSGVITEGTSKEQGAHRTARQGLLGQIRNMLAVGRYQALPPGNIFSDDARSIAECHKASQPDLSHDSGLPVFWDTLALDCSFFTLHWRLHAAP